MKKVLYISLILMTLSSCVRDDHRSANIDCGEFTFMVNIPDARYMTRASWAANDLSINQIIDNMYVLVFDENGFISRHKASQGASPSQFKVTLPTSNDPRVLHFVCNYNWTGFSDEDAAHQSEAMLLANMSVSYPTITYWERREMTSGISGSTLDPVTLIRNVAKISVINNSRAAADADPNDDITSFLTDVQYAIGNYYNKGTVAPFNRTTGLFDTNAIIEAAGATTTAIDKNNDFVPAYSVNIDDVAGRSIFTYERKKSEPGAANRLYLILKANYHTDAIAAGAERFYKIDIALPPPSEDLYDILRNRHYVVTIGQAVHVGYGSFEEAVDGLSLNNFATAIEQEYNSVSDGNSILNVEFTNKTFVTGGAAFAVRYSYIDGTTRATNNTGVAGYVTHGAVPAVNLPDGDMVQGGANLPNQKVGQYPSEYYLDYVNGNMVSTLPADGVVAESSIRISKLGLSRTIILKLRQPYSFAPYSISPTTASSHANVDVDITVTIPAELQDYLPFPIYVEDATMLMPEQGSGIYFEDQGTSFRYRYNVVSTGTHVLNFKTGSTTGAATAEKPIKIRGELFDANANLTLGRN